MQANGHHLGMGGALCVEPVEGVRHVLQQVAGLGHPAAPPEAAVVHLKGVGDDQPLLSIDERVVGEIVVVGVAVVEEASVLHEELTRVEAGTGAYVPAKGPLARRAGDRLDAHANALFLLLAGHIVVGLPSIAVAHDLVAAASHLLPNGGVALQGHGAAVDGGLDPVLVENVQEPPDPGAAAVLD